MAGAVLFVPGTAAVLLVDSSAAWNFHFSCLSKLLFVRSAKTTLESIGRRTHSSSALP